MLAERASTLEERGRGCDTQVVPPVPTSISFRLPIRNQNVESAAWVDATNVPSSHLRALTMKQRWNRRTGLTLVIIAILMGLALPLKSGWCSSICPVYPVENLYAISPFLYADNTLCAGKVPASKPQMLCNGCTRHCLDLKIGAAAEKSRRTGVRWRPRRVVRAFINSFPGFLIAYGLLDSYSATVRFSGFSGAFASYAVFAIAMFVSFSISSLTRRFFNKNSSNPLATGKLIDLVLVAASFNLYYWMAIPSFIRLAAALCSAPESALTPVGVLLMAGVAFLSIAWLRRAW